MKKTLSNQFNKLKVLILGDVMIDRYLDGRVDRISPEAPVPVVRLNTSDNRLGGAANVALNIKALGAEPYLCSVIGEDDNAHIFLNLLPKNNLETEGIITSALRQTTVKTRVMSNAQQLLRVDQEDTFDLKAEEEDLLFQKVENILKEKSIDVLIFQDYNKGVLTKTLIEKVIQLAQSLNIPTAVDPKFKNFWNYKGVDLFKPNLREIDNQCPFPVETNIHSLKETAAFIKNKLANQITLITLSEKGLFITKGAESSIIPTQVRVIADVCGAGDSVISVAALGLALDLDIQSIAELANLAGGQVCERNGVVPIDKKQLFGEMEL